MDAPKKSNVRRTDALSKNRIVQAAIEILDEGGEGALTTRVLASHLSTGSGAIFHHVKDKEELLRASADRIISSITVGKDKNIAPTDSVRSVMLGVFDAFHAHPWVSAQLTREPWQAAVLNIFEDIAGALRALGVSERDLFNTASVLLSYLLGVASQYAAGARIPRQTDRATFLASAVHEWIAVRDPAAHPLVVQVADHLKEHDDRAQFLGGLELILDGISDRLQPTGAVNALIQRS